MKPRSNSQPSEDDSRRIPLAVSFAVGWTIARAGYAAGVTRTMR
jgi:hypothetical protein